METSKTTTDDSVVVDLILTGVPSPSTFHPSNSRLHKRPIRHLGNSFAVMGLRQEGRGVAVAHGGRGEDVNGESINRVRAQRKREQLAGEDDVTAHPLHSIPRRPDHCCETARQPVPPADHPGAEKVLTDSWIRAGLKPVSFQTSVCWFSMFRNALAYGTNFQKH